MFVTANTTPDWERVKYYLRECAYSCTSRAQQLEILGMNMMIVMSLGYRVRSYGCNGSNVFKYDIMQAGSIMDDGAIVFLSDEITLKFH